MNKNYSGMEYIKAISTTFQTTPSLFKSVQIAGSAQPVENNETNTLVLYFNFSYYCEDCKPYNEICYKIVNEIEKYKNDFDFVLVNPDNKCIFFNDITFKNDNLNMPIFEKLFLNKEMWTDEHYSNGNFCDGYDYLLNDCDISVLF